QDAASGRPRGQPSSRSGETGWAHGAPVAERVERRRPKAGVGGSSPSGGAIRRVSEERIIGLAVAADILMGAPLTGAGMNPARWFGPALASGALDNWYVRWIGPLLFAGIAGLLYR